MEKKKEAETAIELMTELHGRIYREESAKNGLLILHAFYGKFENDNETGPLDQIEITKDSTVIDVKIPIQCLVKDSQLIIHTQFKSELAGMISRHLTNQFEFKKKSFFKQAFTILA